MFVNDMILLTFLLHASMIKKMSRVYLKDPSKLQGDNSSIFFFLKNTSKLQEDNSSFCGEEDNSSFCGDSLRSFLLHEFESQIGPMTYPHFVFFSLIYRFMIILIQCGLLDLCLKLSQFYPLSKFEQL